MPLNHPHSPPEAQCTKALTFTARPMPCSSNTNPGSILCTGGCHSPRGWHLASHGMTVLSIEGAFPATLPKHSELQKALGVVWMHLMLFVHTGWILNPNGTQGTSSSGSMWWCRAARLGKPELHGLQPLWLKHCFKGWSSAYNPKKLGKARPCNGL